MRGGQTGPLSSSAASAACARLSNQSAGKVTVIAVTPPIKASLLPKASNAAVTPIAPTNAMRMALAS